MSDSLVVAVAVVTGLTEDSVFNHLQKKLIFNFLIDTNSPKFYDNMLTNVEQFYFMP